MAKRTYHDQNDYKRKRRKRGTPEFATVEDRPVRAETKPHQFLSEWGSYRVMSDLSEDGGLGRTLEEVREARIGAVVEHRAYLKDMATIEKMRADAAAVRISH